MQLGLTKYYVPSKSDWRFLGLYEATIPLSQRMALSLIILNAHKAVCLLIEHCATSDLIRCASQQQYIHLMHGPLLAKPRVLYEPLPESSTIVAPCLSFATCSRFMWSSIKLKQTSCRPTSLKSQKFLACRVHFTHIREVAKLNVLA